MSCSVPGNPTRREMLKRGAALSLAPLPLIFSAESFPSEMGTDALARAYSEVFGIPFTEETRAEVLRDIPAVLGHLEKLRKLDLFEVHPVVSFSRADHER